MGKYIRDIDSDYFGVYLLFFVIYVINCLLFLDLIPTGVELSLHYFNVKTSSILFMGVFGTGMWYISTLMDNEFFPNFNINI